MRYNCLVVWNHGMDYDFPYIGIIIPTDFHIFQRGRYTTNQIIIDKHKTHHLSNQLPSRMN